MSDSASSPKPLLRVQRALVSLADKGNVDELISILNRFNIDTIATGQTAKLLEAKGVAVTEVSTTTGFPEILGGRVKTLHPSIHAAILARKDHPQDQQDLLAHQFQLIDLVVVNLYDFSGSVQKGLALGEVIEHIDIGGSALLRAAAKNYQHVALISSPDDYASLAQEMEAHQGSISESFRAKQAAKAYRLSADYDSQISDYLDQQMTEQDDANAEHMQPLVTGTRRRTLRYGENPHQSADLYATDLPARGLAAAQLLQGKPLSYNNLVDADRASSIVNQFTKPACVIVKHANPCGVAQQDSLTKAYVSAFNADKESAFGGVIAFNRQLDKETAQTIITSQFAELIIAPQVSKEVQQVLKAKKNLRVVALPEMVSSDYHMRFISGGLLKQQPDREPIGELKWVTKLKLTSEQQQEDVHVAWQIVKWCYSNAIVIVRDGVSCGIGMGQTSRVFSVHCALKRARDNDMDLTGAVLASDGFFPYADSIGLIAGTGIAAIIQPGGSIRDEEVIEAADKQNIAMAFTHQRAFFHG